MLAKVGFLVSHSSLDDPPHAGQSNSSVMTSALRRMGSLLQLGSPQQILRSVSAVGEGQKCSARNSMSAFKACVKSADCSWSSPKCPPSMSSHVLRPLMVSKHCLATTGMHRRLRRRGQRCTGSELQAAQRPQAQTNSSGALRTTIVTLLDHMDPSR